MLEWVSVEALGTVAWEDMGMLVDAVPLRGDTVRCQLQGAGGWCWQLRHPEWPPRSCVSTVVNWSWLSSGPAECSLPLIDRGTTFLELLCVCIYGKIYVICSWQFQPFLSDSPLALNAFRCGVTNATITSRVLSSSR